MISTLRQQYNAAFSEKLYQQFLDWIAAQYQYRPPFRIAETPVFISAPFREKLFEASNAIARQLMAPEFLEFSRNALIPGQIVPRESAHTTFLQLDYGVCIDENSGEPVPMLIEAQGFPTLYFYQDFIAKAYRKFFPIPENYEHLIGGLNSETYMDLLRRVIIGNAQPKNVVLLDVQPQQQHTAIDFLIGKAALGFEILCVTDLHQSGKELYYINKAGKKIGIERIYNRLIFDEWLQRKDLHARVDITDDLDLHWVGHPNWFFKISKHSLPFLKHAYVPESFILSKDKPLPDDLENYVLKPLYSFSGSGVKLDVTRRDIEALKDPENHILQRKVAYAPLIQTPSGGAKCEIRILMIWEEGAAQPRMVNNLVRLSKGEMIGVKYNKNKDWVGGSVGFMEP